MIFHSIVPSEIVFGNTSENNSMSLIEMEYLGETVQVTASVNNQYVISRLISTSPRAYLDPRLQPGTVIKGLL